MMSQEIYNKTVFKRFFESNDPRVIAWTENVLDKISSPGILPTFIQKDNKDFQSFWRAVCHLFALIVLYAKQYNEIDTNKILFEFFIENRGLITNEVVTEEQMKYLFDNYVNEYKKRGRLDIISKEGVILGELLRLIQYNKLDEFIFALLMPRDTGWTIGYSSPTWNRTDTVLNITKGYEMTESIEDLSKYPLINPTGVIIVNDIDNEGNQIKAMSFVGNTLTGISSQVDKSKLLIVSSDLAYQIQFKIKVSNPIDQKIHFGVSVYDEYQNPLSCIEAFTVSGQTPIQSNNFVKGDGYLNFSNANVYYQCTGTISKVDKTFSEEVKLNFLSGRGLEFQKGIRYLSLELTQDRSTVTNAISNIYIYDIKIKPIYMPFYQGYLGEKNIIASYFKNNSLSSNNIVKQFIETYLVSYKNIFGGSEIFTNQLVLVKFKVFSDRSSYIQEAQITINGKILMTDINGETTIELYPGEYLVSCEKDKFITIIDRSITIYEQEEQIVYLFLQGELYERKIIFVVKDENNLPVQGALIIFNEKFLNTLTDGTATFFAYPGLYSYIVEKDKYYKVERSVLIQDDMIEQVTLQLIPLYDVTFNVKSNQIPIPDVVITIGKRTAQTNSQGIAIIKELLGGMYIYSVEKKDWIPVSGSILVDSNKSIDIDIQPIPTYNIIFLVNDYNPFTESKIPLQGAIVSYAGITKYTGSDGRADFTVKGGNYSYLVSYTNHVSQNGMYKAIEDSIKTIDLAQEQKITTIRVFGTGGLPLKGASVQILDQTIITDDKGNAVFNLPNGSYSYKVNNTEYYEKTGNLTVNNDLQTISVNLEQKTYAVVFTIRQEGSISVNASVTLNNSTQLTNSLGQVTFYVPVSSVPYSWIVSKADYISQSGSITMSTGNLISKEVDLVKKTSIVIFTVIDDYSSPISGAMIAVAGQTKYTGSDGRADFTVKIGVYDYNVSKLPDFQEQSGNVVVTENNQTVSVILSNKVYNITTTVKSPTGRVLSGVTVNINGKIGTTNFNGQVTLSNFKNGNYSLNASLSNYESYNSNVSISGADKYVEITLNYLLTLSTVYAYKEGSVLVGKTINVIVYDKNDDRYNTVSQSTDNYGKITYNGPSGGSSSVSVEDSECVALENISFSNGSTKYLYLWKALILTFNNSTSLPSGLNVADWDRNGNDVRCCPNAKNNPSFVNGLRLPVNCLGMTRLIAIKQWPSSFYITGSTGTWTDYGGNYGVFKDCIGLSSIATGSPLIYGGVIQWFMGCTSLRSFPSGLFLNMTGNSISEVFRDCTSLTTTSSGPLVPLNTIYHGSSFRDCTSLTTIGDSIFGKGGGEDDFHAVFRGCTNVTTLGTSLQDSNSPFKRSTDALNIKYTFSLCSKIQLVPLLYFRNCTKVINITSLFSDCINLRDYSMSMFAWMTTLTNMTTVFYGCTYLSSPDGGIPDTVTTIYGIFQKCNSIISLDNFKLIDKTNLKVIDLAFSESGVRNIPYQFLAGTRLTSAVGAFKNCKGLTEFSYFGSYTVEPATKFITTAYRNNMFQSTAFLNTTYPELNCTEMFYGCSNLKAGNSDPFNFKVISLWPGNGKLIGRVNVNRMFYGCSNLNTIPGYNTTTSIAGTNFVNITDITNSNIISHSQTFTGTGIDVPSGWS